MNYYVDDIYFATMPHYSKEIHEKFHQFWPIKKITEKYNLNDNFYFIQDCKNKEQIMGKLIPSLIQKIVPEVKYLHEPKLFSIVRESITNSPYDFDYVSEQDKGFLREFMYFTALIHPTPIDLAYCARVIYKDQNRTEIDRVIPNMRLGNGSQFKILSKEGEKSFLTPVELEESYLLYNLYKDLIKKGAIHQNKINAVINNYLASFWQCWFEISIVIVVSALESLFNTIEKGKRGITEQFKNRIPIVSEELKKEGYLARIIKVDEAETLYNLRCDYTHRGEFSIDEEEYKDIYVYLELGREILSGIINKCIKYPDFVKIFDSYDDVDKKWPV